MKKILLFTAAALAAFALTELFVGIVIGYPSYGVKEKINICGYKDFQLIFYPYTKYWNVESGNKVFRRNNLGFPGIDIKISKDSKYILMLGNSTLEGLQIKPEVMGTSIFQKKLNQVYSEYQVINLAYSNHSPYDLWIRLSYFEKIYKPAYVILLMQHTANEQFKNHQGPLSFEPIKDLGKRDESISTKIKLNLRNNSHFFNLLANGIISLGVRRNLQLQKMEQMERNSRKETIPENFLVTLKQYQKKYQDKFIFVYIGDDEKISFALKNYCMQHGIQFSFDSIHHKKRLIRGEGHLNEEGHKKMGEFLFETFKKFAR